MTSIVLWAPFVAAAAALSGVWLQSYLTRRQTFGSRIWDLQREAYGEILAGMAEAEHHMADLHLELDTLTPSDIYSSMAPAGALTKLLDRYGEAAGGVRRRAARDRLILPTSFVQVYDEFAELSRKLDVETTLTAHRASKMKSLISSYRVKLEEAARADLKRDL